MGYIYIMTNPALHDMVKIGYATNVEKRRKELSTTALPYDYEVYATYQTPGKLEDRKLHALIDNLNPDLRVSPSREFYIMTPQDAYELLEAIATISGSVDKLKMTNVDEEKKQDVKRPNIDFYQCGLNDGDELVFVNDPSVVAVVQGEHKVLYKDELTSVSAIAKGILGYSVSGSKFFTYNGELLENIAKRTQWREY